MYLPEPAARRREPERFVYPVLPLFLWVMIVVAVVPAPHAAFPLLPLLLIATFIAIWRFGRLRTWRLPAAESRTDGRNALSPAATNGEKEILRVLDRHGEVTAAKAALGSSLSVAEAEKILSDLANEGHVRVAANDGRLTYALWD